MIRVCRNLAWIGAGIVGLGVIVAAVIGAFVLLASLTGSAARGGILLGSFLGFCACVALYFRAARPSSQSGG